MKQFECKWASVQVTIAKNKHTEGKATELRRILACAPTRKRNFELLSVLWNAEGNPDEQDRLKKNLPIWFPGGVFTGRHSLSERQSFSRILCLDIDGKDNPGKTPEEMKNALSDWRSEEGFPYAGYVGLTCRRKGVFALIQLPKEAHSEEEFKKYYKAAEKELKSLFGIVADCKSSNPAQGRFLSYDEEPVFNPDIATWTKQEDDNTPRKKIRDTAPDKGLTRTPEQTMEYIVQKAEFMMEPLFYSQREWWQSCVALSCEFGESGREWFLRLSDVWCGKTGQKQEQSPNELYNKTLRNRGRYHTDFAFICRRAIDAGLLP